MKSGNLNFLEPSRPLQACNGTDVCMYVCVYIYMYVCVCVCIMYRSFATTVSQFKMCAFSGETFKGFEVL